MRTPALRFLTILFVLVLSSACEANPKKTPTPTDNKEPAAMEPVRVTWTIKPEPSSHALRIDYQVENHTKKTIHLLDQLMIPGVKGVTLAPDRVIVRRGPDAATVSLVAGHVRPEPGQAVAWEAVPSSRPVAAGASVSGSKLVPLPIAAWHPYMTLQPIATAPTQAVFEVVWLPDEPPSGLPAWEDHPAAQGGPKIRTPSEVFVVTKMQTARGPVQKLPTP